MSVALALIVERDAALRQLMSSSVARAGYDILECSNPLQLKVEAHSLPVVEVPKLLVVLSADVARECARELTALLRARASAGMPAFHAVFTCEFGAVQPLPVLGTYALMGVLEKPFELDELERIARGCRLPAAARIQPTSG